MTANLTLYTHPMSRGRTVRWMLEECGATYDTVLLDYGTNMKAPAYLAINPMGKVPALQHGDAVVTECAAICTYLADLFPEKKLAPPVGSAARGAYYPEVPRPKKRVFPLNIPVFVVPRSAYILI